MKSLLILFAFAVPLGAQTYCGLRQDNVTNALGQAIPNVAVTYYSQPSMTPATVYSSTTCTPTTTGNPQYTNGLGLANIYLTPGLYTVTYSGAQIQTQTFVDQNVPANGSTGGGLPVTNPSYTQTLSGSSSNTAFSNNLFQYAINVGILTAYDFQNGRNFYSPGGDKTTDQSTYTQLFTWTPSQHYGHNLNTTAYGVGDAILQIGDVAINGGPTTGGDEAGECCRFNVFEQGVIFQAPFVSLATASDGTETVTTGTATNPGTEGAGRPLIDVTARQALTITNIANGSDPVITVSGISPGTSTTTTLTAGIVDSGSNLFPIEGCTLAVASASGFTIGNLLGIYDYDFEIEKITNISGNNITVGQCNKPHPSGAFVSTGGAVGTYFGAAIDEKGPGSYGASNGFGTLNGMAQPSDSNLNSTVRSLWPVYQSTGTTLTLFCGYNFIPGTSGCAYTGQAYPNMGTGGTVTISGSIGSLTCTASGGSGYGGGYSGNSAPAQVTISGITGGTAPVLIAYQSGSSSPGALNTCQVISQGSGWTGTPTGTVNPINVGYWYPAAARVNNVYDATANINTSCSWYPGPPTATGTYPPCAVDGVMATTPHVGTFTAGDTLEVANGTQQRTSGLLTGSGHYQPGQSVEPQNGWFHLIGGYYANSDTAIDIDNANDPTLYQNYVAGTPWVQGRGHWITPRGFTLDGPWATGLNMAMPPFGGGEYGYFGSGAVKVNCGSNTCVGNNFFFNFLNSSNYLSSGNGNDVLAYNQSTATWQWTAGASGTNGGSPQCGLNLSPTALTGIGTCAIPFWQSSGTNVITANSGGALKIQVGNPYAVQFYPTAEVNGTNSGSNCVNPVAWINNGEAATSLCMSVTANGSSAGNPFVSALTAFMGSVITAGGIPFQDFSTLEFVRFPVLSADPTYSLDGAVWTLSTSPRKLRWNANNSVVTIPSIGGTPTPGNCVAYGNSNFWQLADAGAPCTSGTVSGQASGVIPLGTTATTITGQSHMDDGNSHASAITSTEPIYAPAFYATSGTQTTVNCSTSGTAIFSQPFTGAYFKVVAVTFAACVGTASYTFPTAYTNQPSVQPTNDAASTLVTTRSATAVTVTGTTSTGTLTLIGY